MEEVFHFAASVLLDGDPTIVSNSSKSVEDEEHHQHHHTHLTHHQHHHEAVVETFDLIGASTYSHDYSVPLRDRAFSWDVALDPNLTPELFHSLLLNEQHNNNNQNNSSHQHHHHPPPQLITSEPQQTPPSTSNNNNNKRKVHKLKEIKEEHDHEEIFADGDDFLEDEDVHGFDDSMPPPSSDGVYETTLTSRNGRSRLRFTLKAEPQTNRMTKRQKASTGSSSSSIDASGSLEEGEAAEGAAGVMEMNEQSSASIPVLSHPPEMISDEEDEEALNITHVELPDLSSATPSLLPINNNNNSSSSSTTPPPLFTFAEQHHNNHYTNNTQQHPPNLPLIPSASTTPASESTTQTPATNASNNNINLNGSSSDRKVGAYTVEERRMKIEKFRERKRQRIWRKQIKYDCRKRLADTRPRVKGRFVSRKNLGSTSDPLGSPQKHDDDEDSIASTGEKLLDTALESSILGHNHSIQYNHQTHNNMHATTTSTTTMTTTMVHNNSATTTTNILLQQPMIPIKMEVELNNM